jgi:predicted ATPase
MVKTTLVDVFLQDLVKDAQAFYLARSRSSESLTEAEPFISWIEALSGIAKEPSVADIMQKEAPTWYREITHTGSGVGPQMKRELVDFCGQISTLHPLVIVIDDFQFSDNGSVDLLSFLLTASVQGREFDSAVLATSMQMSPEDVEESLQELHETYGWIHRIREEQLTDGKYRVRYRFVYAFCQEACYASLAPSRKASLNASLAEAFLTYYGN